MSTLVSWVMAVVLSFLGAETPSETTMAVHTEVIHCNLAPQWHGCQGIKNEQIVSNDTF